MKKFFLAAILTSGVLFADTVTKMDQAMEILTELMPYLFDDKKFVAKENEAMIRKNLERLDQTFKSLGHEEMLKKDLFAPSYELIRTNLNEGLQAFNKKDKGYAQWLYTESISTCLDCHTRLPVEHASKFQNGDLQVATNKINSPYNQGLAFLIVRKYIAAKESFTRSIQDRFIKKDFEDMIVPFQQILMIETKVFFRPVDMVVMIDNFLKKELPWEVSYELRGWRKRLLLWKDEPVFIKGINDDSEVRSFISRRLTPIMEESFEDSLKVDYLFISGILSRYFFDNPQTKLAPELSYWIGWLEKRLKQESFISSGDLFLKQCIRKYPATETAKKCFEEYKESVEFDFSGSSGTHIPLEVKKELDQLNDLLSPVKKNEKK